jgi:hypothetical protein
LRPQEERANERPNRRVVLTREEADAVIAQLNPRNQRMLAMIFQQPVAHLQLTDQDVLRVANEAQEIIDQLFGRAGVHLLQEVARRVHRAHFSDTGDLLPGSYLRILRMPFVGYGLVPSGWTPQSIEDFSAQGDASTTRS